MDFLKILRSFEEFLFEAASWLIFYPVTMWRIIRRPLATMDYSDREQTDPEERRYDDALSPPLMLLATIVLTNAVSLAAHVPPPQGASHVMHALASSQQNLVLFRSLMFSLIPLIAAVTMLHRQGRKVSRESLRGPFYAQCYLAAPCAVFVSIGAILVQRPETFGVLGPLIMAGGALWFLAIQTEWFRKKLNLGRLQAAGIAVWAMVRALIYLIAILIPVALL